MFFYLFYYEISFFWSRLELREKEHTQSKPFEAHMGQQGGCTSITQAEKQAWDPQVRDICDKSCYNLRDEEDSSSQGDPVRSWHVVFGFGKIWNQSCRGCVRD